MLSVFYHIIYEKSTKTVYFPRIPRRTGGKVIRAAFVRLNMKNSVTLYCEGNAVLLWEYESKPSLDLYDVAEFHATFEKIHPFYDGNGRIGRLLMLKQCLANSIVPFFINEEIKHFYYVGLKEWQLEEKKNRLLDVCLTMQDDMKAILDYFRIGYDKTELTARELINKHI